MIAYLPIPGGHIALAERFVSPAFSFTMGWNYWYNWTIILPAELSAASVLVGFWTQDVNPAVWIVVCMVVVIVINLLGAGEFSSLQHFRNDPDIYPLILGAYGEAEFIFAYVTLYPRVSPGPSHRHSSQFYQGYHNRWSHHPRNRPRPWR